MKVEEFDIEGPLLITPRVFEDDRGYFFESFNDRRFAQHAHIETLFIQDNESLSSLGTLRGLHFQRPPFAQAKLVRVVQGSVLDVIVDIRRRSNTFGQYLSVVLSGENKKQLYVPKGFAHGFLALSEQTLFQYKVDNYYSPDHDAGILWNDTDLCIDWTVEDNQVVLSKKDTSLQSFAQYAQNPDF